MPTATPASTTQAVVPFTPVEEVLTPPPDIDTSGWLTYQDQEHGFELKYPPGGSVRQNVRPETFGVSIGAHETGTEIDLPFASETTLEAKYLFITETDIPVDDCVPFELTYALKMHATPNVQYVRSASAGFWKSYSPGGGMMHWSNTTFYFTSSGDTCVTLFAVLAGVSPGAFSTPPPSPDKEKESRVFPAIVATFRWLDQP